MNQDRTFLTREGHHKLEEELSYLCKVRRHEVAERLHLALGEGELLDNAELEDARNEQSFVEGRILTIENLLRNFVIIEDVESKGPREMVGIGTHVTVTEGDAPPETYHIVGSAEADPMQGMISNESPLGRALMGHKVGETAEVSAPDGVLVFKIAGIR